MSLIVFVLLDKNNRPPEFADWSTFYSAVLLKPSSRVFGSAPDMILILAVLPYFVDTKHVTNNYVLVPKLLFT